jgi:hypothetical protein
VIDYLTEREEPRWTRWLLLVFVPLAWLYWTGAWGNSDTFNTTHEASRSNDQKVYIKLAQDLKQSGYEMYTPRQRTPGYSYVLSVFYNDSYAPAPGEIEGEKYSMRWFHRCREISVWISMIGLAGLYFFFRRFLGRVESGFFVAALGCMLFVFRAGYTQPEVLYWSLKLPLFFLMWRMLIKPSWLLGGVCGVLTALGFMVKGGTQPLLLLFVVSFGLKLLWDWFRERGELKSYGIQAIKGALVPALFIALLFPYFHYSYKQFGEPFYSVYSKYLMWTLPEVTETSKDGKNEYLYIDRRKTRAIQDTHAAYHPITLADYRIELKEFKERYNEEYIEPDGLPSASRYLERQNLSQIIARGMQGVERTNARMLKYYHSSWDFLRRVMMIALVVALVRWRRVLSVFKERAYLPFYFVGFFAGYAFLYGWYDALRIGPRLMLGLYPMALFAAFYFVRNFTDDLAVPFRGKRLLVSKLLNVVFVVLLAYHARKVFTNDLYLYFSGT